MAALCGRDFENLHCYLAYIVEQRSHSGLDDIQLYRLQMYTVQNVSMWAENCWGSNSNLLSKDLIFLYMLRCFYRMRMLFI